jgi:ribosome-binding factor A
MTRKDERMAEVLRDFGAKFLHENSNKSSLLTVTRVELTNKGKNATIFFTAFPENFEKTALEFAKRKRTEFRAHIIENSRIGNVPRIDFEIDLGEKNRQRIDSLLS